MSLITEINRTETEKNKTKQVATNIDNKLVELGGEQATDLADVPNKMEVMVKTQYEKIATMQSSQTIQVIRTNQNEFRQYRVNTSFSFIPSRILVNMSIHHKRYIELTTDRVIIDSKYHYNNSQYLELELNGSTYNLEFFYITNKSKTGFDLYISAGLQPFRIDIKEITALS